MLLGYILKSEHKTLINKFELAFCQPEIKNLLSKRWLIENNKKGSPPSTGFCYIAAEAAFHLLKYLNPKPYCASYNENGIKSTHWWIEVDSIIVDPTASQYYLLNEKPPYDLGIRKGFLTKQPSKRAQILIDYINNM